MAQIELTQILLELEMQDNLLRMIHGVPNSILGMLARNGSPWERIKLDYCDCIGQSSRLLASRQADPACNGVFEDALEFCNAHSAIFLSAQLGLLLGKRVTVDMALHVPDLEAAVNEVRAEQ